MKQLIMTAATLLLSVAAANSQTSLDEMRLCPDKTGGIYYAYPADGTETVTPPPTGYKPFYISHFSRHGSRYLISDKDYINLAAQLRKARQAGALTPLGDDMLTRLDTVIVEALGRGGELTPLGHRQHRMIGRRMIEHYPEAFEGNTRIFARSTVVMRCAHSMNSLCEGLKEVKPSLNIVRESSKRHMDHLNYHTPEANKFTSRDGGPCVEIMRKFKQECTQPDRLMSVIFSDSVYAHNNVNPDDFMWAVYWVTVDMQNMESPIRFDDILTLDERFALWQSHNYAFYAHNASNPMAGGLLVACAKPSLRNMVDCADHAIASNSTGADLRFAHDGNLIPLAALMHLDGCYGEEADPHKLHHVYADFKVAPMAGNVQMVFFKNKKNDVIVKFLLNERETNIPLPTDNAPFYAWNDVRDYFNTLIDTPTAQ